MCGNHTHPVPDVKDRGERRHRSVTGVAFLPLRDPGATMDILPTVACCFHLTTLFGVKGKVS